MNLTSQHSSTWIPRWISDWFKKADKDRDGRMNFKEVRDLLKMMNVDMNEHHALRLFTVRASGESCAVIEVLGIESHCVSSVSVGGQVLFRFSGG